ncbi:prefoldin subunit alpha [Candidatus Woesearchaeota archaeon]|nr:prefoldin subunit alpha [Candidatus Woesearchaeota archaeon]
MAEGEISKEKQQQLQQKYMEMQMLSQQMQQAQKQIEMVNNQINELNLTKEALDDISKTKEGTEIRVPLASGIFIKANLTDNKDVIVNVGAGTSVKKTIPEARKLIDDQLKEITDFARESEANLNQLAAKAQTIEKELTELAK